MSVPLCLSVCQFYYSLFWSVSVSASSHFEPPPPPVCSCVSLPCSHVSYSLVHLCLTSHPSLHLCPTVTHEHLKEHGLFSLPPPPPGANPTDYYHLMASGRSTYGDLIMQTGAAAAAAAAAAHLPDYISPMDGESP